MTFPDLARVTALTFDCYGTLIDWEAGAIETLRPLLAKHEVTLSDDEIIQALPGHRYGTLRATLPAL
jgi:FMN phosphatase YigB (HAD superfamily)